MAKTKLVSALEKLSNVSASSLSRQMEFASESGIDPEAAGTNDEYCGDDEIT